MLIVLIVSCSGGTLSRRIDRPVADRVRLAGTVNADIALAGQRFLSQQTDLRQYIFLVRDRAGKYRMWEQDQGWRDDYDRGDGDGDLVPDARDRCKDTRPLAITDQTGCEIQCRGLETEPCGSRVPPPEAEADVRRLLDSVAVMINPRCDGAPVPTMPEPLEWGRDSQSRINGVGFNFSMTRVPNQPADCELFYELDLQLEDSGRAGDPPIRYVSVLFKADENLVPGDTRRVVFGIPNVAGFPSVAWTPGRTTLQTALNYYRVVTWRVRAVNGAQRASSWSAPRVQQASPGGLPA